MAIFEEPPRKMRIRWIVLDESIFGHGVEFHYTRGMQPDARFVVAFIEGFRWFKHPDQKSVTVKILPKDSPSFKLSKTPVDEILKAIRFGVKKFFEAGPRNGHITEDVKAWWNC